MASGAAETSESRAAVGGVTLHIRCFNGSKFSLQIGIDATVGSLKSVVARSCDVAVEQQRLIYKGQFLRDEHTLESYGMEADHTVHLVRCFAPATSAIASDSGVPNSTPSGMTSVGSSEVGARWGCGMGASLSSGLGFNGLSDNSELFGAGLPILQQVQQKLTQNPYLMREITDMPSIYNVVDNQNIMQNVIMNDPQIFDLIDRNPELAHILTDPSTIRETFEVARNPELMCERMNNTDRVITNIESSHEGLNMLRQMHENAQEPFLNATTRSGALPNPWASGGDNAGLETLTNMFGGLGTGTHFHGLNVPPEELYAAQILQLLEMGFMDPRENLQALIATAGNVHAVVERLLSQ